MVSIAAGVAEAEAIAVVAKVITTVRNWLVAVMPIYPRPVFKFFSQGSTSLSAVSPDAHITIGGLAVA